MSKVFIIKEKLLSSLCGKQLMLRFHEMYKFVELSLQ